MAAMPLKEWLHTVVRAELEVNRLEAALAVSFHKNAASTPLRGRLLSRTDAVNFTWTCRPGFFRVEPTDY